MSKIVDETAENGADTSGARGIQEGLWVRLHDGGAVRWRHYGPDCAPVVASRQKRGLHVLYRRGEAQIEALIPWTRIFEVRSTASVTWGFSEPG